MVFLIDLDGQVFKLLLGKLGKGRGSCTCDFIFTLFFRHIYPLCNGGIYSLFIMQLSLERSILQL